MRDLNFFQTTAAGDKDDVSKTVITFGTIAMTILIGGTLAYNTLAISRTNADIAELKNNMADNSFVSKYNESQEIAKKSDAYKRYSDTLNKIYLLVNDRDKVQPYLLKKISYTVPKEVYLSSLNSEGGTVVITARSSSRSAIAEFQHNIGELDFIDSSHVGEITSDMSEEKEAFTFSITCELKEEYYDETK